MKFFCGIVKSRDRYRISIHQVEGRSRRIIGSVEFNIPVPVKADRA